MGDWGRNGSKRKLTVRSGDSWESLADRAGLSPRQFEDLMRANPNILQLKAGQTISTGGMKRNNNAYVSDYTAAANGMATSDQLKDAYSANGTGGAGSSRLQQGTAVPGGNFGYNLSTKGGRAQLAWQNNANNPYGASVQKPLAPAVVKPVAGVPGSNLAPVGYGNNAAVAPGTGTVETITSPPPSLSGQAAAQQWTQQDAAQKNANAVRQGNTLERGMVSGVRPTTGVSAGAQVPQDIYSKTFGGASVQQPAQQNAPTAPASNGLGYSRPTPQAAADAANARMNPQDSSSAAAQTAYTVQQQDFSAAQTITALSSNNPALFPNTIDTGTLSGISRKYPNKTFLQITVDLASAGYVQDSGGNFVRSGDTSSQGGPSFSSSVPSGYGDYAGLPAYAGPPEGYYVPTYNVPSNRPPQTQQQQSAPANANYSQSGTWRIG